MACGWGRRSAVGIVSRLIAGYAIGEHMGTKTLVVPLSEVDDPTIMTAVSELARLKKVISFADGVINGVDPELVPPATWDQVDQHANTCNSQIASYISNFSESHLTNTNTAADHLLTHLRPYMIIDSGLAATLQQSLITYSEFVDQTALNTIAEGASTVQRIKDSKIEADGFVADIKPDKAAADKFRADIFREDENDPGIKKQFEDLGEELLDRHKKIVKLHNTLLVGSEEILSTKKSIADSQTAIEANEAEIEALLSSVIDQVSELSNFHVKIFGPRHDDDEGEDGLSARFDELQTNMESFEKA
jgi:hypothetical protein